MIDNSKNPGGHLRKNQFLACFFGLHMHNAGHVYKWLKPYATCIEYIHVNHQDQQVPGKQGKLSKFNLLFYRYLLHVFYNIFQVCLVYYNFKLGNMQKRRQGLPKCAIRPPGEPK